MAFCRLFNQAVAISGPLVAHWEEIVASEVTELPTAIREMLDIRLVSTVTDALQQALGLEAWRSER